jgi:hypothetical protein
VTDKSNATCSLEKDLNKTLMIDLMARPSQQISNELLARAMQHVPLIRSHSLAEGFFLIGYAAPVSLYLSSTKRQNE